MYFSYTVGINRVRFVQYTELIMFIFYIIINILPYETLYLEF